MTDVWYSPGTWLVLAGPTTQALADLDHTSPVLAEWAVAVRSGAGPDELLSVLMQHGLVTVPSFALCSVRPDGLRVVLRGEARVSLTDGRELSAEGAPTWRDGIVGLDAAPVRLAGPLPATGAARLPLDGGVAFAASVELYPSVRPVPAESGVPPLVAPAAPMPAVVSPAAPDAVPMAEPGPPAPPIAAATEEPRATEVADYSHLFAPSVARPPTPAPPVPVEPAVTEAVPVSPAAAPEDTLAARPDTDVPATACDEVPPAAAVAPRVDDGGVISAFPWESGGVPVGTAVVPEGAVRRPPAPPVPPEPVAAPWSSPVADDPHPVVAQAEGDHTVARSALPPTPAPVGPTVLAAYCPAGHLSPVHAQSCRVCDRSMPPHQQSMTIPRPVLGVLRLPGGQTIPLDRGVLLGRAPAAPDHGAGLEQPHVVSVASPDKDVSRNHVEIRLDGWHVLAVDLGSVNGTVVVLPGRPPQRLRAEEPVILERGTQVVLADEVTVVFEVPA